MLKLKTISEQIYDYVVQKIMRGELKPGQRITETDLLQDMDASRTPIREALMQLAVDGILVNSPRKGYFVKEYNFETARYQWRVIAQLDAYAAELALDTLSEDDYGAMQNCIDAIDDAIDKNDMAKYNEMQHAFHDVYLNRSGNPVLIDTEHSLLFQASRASLFVSMMHGVQSATKVINDDHRKILKFFKEKKRAELRQTIIEHWTTLSYESANE